MRGSRKFFQREPNLDYDFLVDDGREDPNITISGPSSARQRSPTILYQWVKGVAAESVLDMRS